MSHGVVAIFNMSDQKPFHARGVHKEGCPEVRVEKRGTIEEKKKKGKKKKKKKGAKAKKNDQSEKAIPRLYTAHESLGGLRLVMGKVKSYILATQPAPGHPKYICEYTEKQVGEEHGLLMVELCKEASKSLLQRDEIKELRRLVLEKFLGVFLIS